MRLFWRIFAYFIFLLFYVIDTKLNKIVMLVNIFLYKVLLELIICIAFSNSFWLIKISDVYFFLLENCINYKSLMFQFLNFNNEEKIRY